VTLLTNNWVLNDAVLNYGTTSIDVGWRAYQNIKLKPGQSYTLKFTAKNANLNGSVTVSLKFLTLEYEPFRNFTKTVTGNVVRTEEIHFTAPMYAEKAELLILAKNTRTVISNLTLVERSAIPVTELTVPTQYAYPPVGYRLVFNDEFVGTELNRAKWHTRYIYAGGTLDKLDGEAQDYRDNNNHVVKDGVLHLIGRKVGDRYESGMIRSDWTTKYGYFEARVKMPKGLGVFPAFWLNSDVSEFGELGWPPEIDIFEFVNNGAEEKPNMLHSGVVTTDGKPSKLLSFVDPTKNNGFGWYENYRFYRAPFDFTDDWHTIGLEWTTKDGVDILRSFIDGKQINAREAPWKYPDGLPGGPAHIILDLALGGAWAGKTGIDPGPFDFQVNWVRVYKKV
jgi:beta-glucanase (GH16 family)